MIVECSSKEKELTRKLYEEAFEDPKDFVDYYYSEKCTDNRIIASIEEGEVISMLHLNPYYVNLNGTKVKTYYVVAVATTKKRRHEGQMTKVFEKAFELIAQEKEKIPFVFLLPVDQAIYSWLGFDKICDFATDKIADYEEIKRRYDVYCIRDNTYIRRMKKEDALREQENGEVLPDNPVIMAKITDLEAFENVARENFADEKQALKWLTKKNVYICEEV